MNPMNIPSMGAATASGMPVGQQPAVGLSQAATTSPATNFTHHHILGDGDSLFRATYMGLSNQPGVEPSQDQVAGLRQYLADYVYRHQDALSANPAFGGQQGVMNLYDLLLTPGQWDHSAGDLVAPLLAQVSGRALAVLQAVQEGAAYSVRQVFPAENPSLPPGSGQTGEPSICLAHINGNHYAYLEQRYPGVLPDLLNQPWERENLPSPSHYLNDQGPGAIMSEEPSQKTQGENKRGKTSARKSQISQMQRDTLAHLWRDNPQWGLRKISNEFNRRYPGLNVTQSVVRAMKKSHSDLRGLNLGSQTNEPKLSDTQRKALIELWKQNAGWGETKIAKEYNERNPGAEITSSTVRNMKRRYPGLQGLKLGSEKNGKKLSDEQRQEIAQLWRQNPQWNEEQMAREYIDRNPGVKVIGG